MKIKYLVTGGAGFIGSHIVELLVKRGHKVRVLDNFSTGFKAYLKPFQGRIEVQKGDVRNTRDCLRAARGAEFVIHQAAFTSVAKSVETPSEVHEIDATGTLNMLEAAKISGSRRFVYASSCSVYGNATHFPLREGDPVKPLSPYAVAKLTGELYTYSYFVNYGLETVALRYFNVFGSRQNPMSKYSAAVPGILERLKKNQQPVIYGDGKQSRDFVHAKDVARANYLASTVPAAKGQVFNIGAGEQISILRLAKELARVAGKTNLGLRYEKRRPSDPDRTDSDISKARKILGWKPEVTLNEGLAETARWFL